MAHFLTVPINSDGIITDPNIDTEIQTLAAAPFSFTDVFLYSHGWWNTASDASSEYNNFSTGFTKKLLEMVAVDKNGGPAALPGITANFNPLALGLIWPSMISENQDSVENFLEATSFFTMMHRADTVGQHAGYAILRLLIEAWPRGKPLKIHFIGHSFGCRVILSALQAITSGPEPLAGNGVAMPWDVALIQPAIDADSLDMHNMYSHMLNPSLARLLVTISDNDRALCRWYPEAQRLAHLFSDPILAMGAAGPSPWGCQWVTSLNIIDPGVPVGPSVGDFQVANLTPLHVAHRSAYGDDPFAGQHADINLPEIYELLARFMFGATP